MKEERKVIFIGSIFNFMIAIIKLVGGLLFKVNSLLVDSIYTFCDFITDIISIIGSKLAGKRPTKYHPFGFGRVEYITNLFISILLFIVGVFLFIHSFNSTYEVPSLVSFFIVIIAVLAKIGVVSFLEYKNKKLKSPVLADGIEESKLDVMSTVLIGIAIILLQFSDQLPFLRYSDLLVSIGMSILIIKTALVLLKNNILNLLGTVEVDEELIEHVKDEIDKNDKIDIRKVELIKYGRYYKAHLVVCLNGDITLKQAKKIQLEIIKKLKKIRKIKIKVVNVDLDIV